ncbi:RING-H2 finger protein [Melia azedarach]|uniref:RING-H2 finger protein n=1 Tax=Melia azedarach TaxID=155640 RepID=A0ACC1XVD7_MELAZ|nr:RING-H2 finger protein [Melia azedarach]
MSTLSFTSTQLFQDFLENFPPRKLLQEKPLNQQQLIAAPPPYPGDRSFDLNVLTVLVVLLCALICSVGLASVLKFTLRSSRSAAASEPSSNSSAGLQNRGIKQKALKTFAVVKYSEDVNLPGLDTECVICLSEFEPGERLRFLPKCSHGFHVRCIDKWLRKHSSCPKCRHCLIETCQKIMGCSQDEAASSSAPSTAVQETVVSIISPLEPEAMVRSCRGLS